MPWNKEKSETELLRAFREALKSRLPDAWDAILTSPPTRAGAGSA